MRHCLKLMGWGLRNVCIAGSILALSSLCPAQAIRMTVQQVWSGISTFEATPYYANIENRGSNENGFLTASSQESPANMEYPIELPSGTKKRILFLSGGWNDGKVYLRTSSGFTDATIRNGSSGEQTKYGLISDNPSDLIFMKGQSDSTSNSNAIGVGGCIPDDAPDRSWGYDCLDALVLGDGTEKLRDDQILAIRHYVQEGGVLLFVGGAAPSASGDSRWSDLMPISKTSVVTQNGLTELVGSPVLGSIRVQMNRAKCRMRSYGLGIVSVLSVNPFESPVKEYDDRRSILSKALPRTRHQQIHDLMQQQIGLNEVSYLSSYGSAPAPAMTAYSASGPGKPSGATAFSAVGSPGGLIYDPYQIKPPSVASIMWILIAYAIVVVPINFFVLKRLNRLEIAWISTPVISVAFSLILLDSTIGLYKSSATTRTTAVAILGNNNHESMVYGRSEMFFPRAQSYNLHLNNVETLISQRQYSEPRAGGLNLIDDGRHITAPSVSTANLAFKELSYIEASNELAGLTMTLEIDKGQTVLHIRNQSHTNLSRATLFGAGMQLQLVKPVPIGANIVEPVSKIMNSKPTRNDNSSQNGWQVIAGSSPTKLIVIATADTMNIGPRYGGAHPSSQYLVVTTPQWSEPL